MRLSAVLAVAALVVAIPLATDATSLRSLYNSRVVRVELVTRPILSSGNVHTGLPHAGVRYVCRKMSCKYSCGHAMLFRLTLEDGSQWLVHKGPDYGGSGGDTVVTSASHMSGNWNVIRSKDVHGTR